MWFRHRRGPRTPRPQTRHLPYQKDGDDIFESRKRINVPSILPQRKQGGVVLAQENEEAVQIMPADEMEEAFLGMAFRHVVSFVGEILWD